MVKNAASKRRGSLRAKSRNASPIFSSHASGAQAGIAATRLRQSNVASATSASMIACLFSKWIDRHRRHTNAPSDVAHREPRLATCFERIARRRQDIISSAHVYTVYPSRAARKGAEKLL
jgi:hypothetical protein